VVALVGAAQDQKQAVGGSQGGGPAAVRERLRSPTARSGRNQARLAAALEAPPTMRGGLCSSHIQATAARRHRVLYDLTLTGSLRPGPPRHTCFGAGIEAPVGPWASGRPADGSCLLCGALWTAQRTRWRHFRPAGWHRPLHRPSGSWGG